MVKRQWIIFNCQTDQSQMISIGSPTLLSGPKIDDGIIESWLRWVDCHYTWKENGRCSNHTKYQHQPGRADSAQSLVVTQQGQNLKLKNCYCFLKRKKMRCWARQSSWETFCLRGWMLLLNFVSHCASHHTIWLAHTGTSPQERCVRLHRNKLSNRGRSVGREKGSCAYVLGQMTLAIELRNIIGHQTGGQATCGEPMLEDKWYFLRTVL